MTHPKSEIAMRAGCAFVLADRRRLAEIARAARAEIVEVTGPTAEAAARLIERGQDPECNIGWIVDFCRRELEPKGTTIDPMSFDPETEIINFYIPAKPQRLGAYHDEHVGARTGRRRAAAQRGAIAAGQTGFTGWAWRTDMEGLA